MLEIILIPLGVLLIILMIPKALRLSNLLISDLEEEYLFEALLDEIKDGDDTNLEKSKELACEDPEKFDRLQMALMDLERFD